MSAPTVQHLRIGMWDVVEGVGTLEANLGSCLGMVIGWPAMRRYALAHILLPRSPAEVREAQRGRYADTAPALLLEHLKVPRSRRPELRAIMAGCAQMYDDASNRGIGRNNEEAGRKALRALKIRLLGLDTGLSVARRMRVDAATGFVSVFHMPQDDTTPSTQWRIAP